MRGSIIACSKQMARARLRGLIRALLLFGLMACSEPTAPGDGLSGALPVAVLGDSDSTSYHDDLSRIDRGGAYRAQTFNWPWIWHQLRGGEVDLGKYAAFGDRLSIARVKVALGIPTRTPEKEDFRYNYARTGAGCASLAPEWPHQLDWLLAQIKAAPESWAGGVVILRIGVNDFGQREHLLAGRGWTGMSAQIARVDACLRHIGAAVQRLRARSPVRIALIGIAHDVNAPDNAADWAAPEDLARAIAPLQRFDAGLRAMARTDPRIAFIDDVSWFEAKFGARILGAVHPVAEIGGIPLRHGLGDAPENLILSDGHAGTLANGLFLAHLVERLNSAFDLGLSEIRESEIAALVRDAAPDR
ncbi:MAG: SGNH/GDSL hydrolase family protein [Neomegalonema sp.]|nr:SGNH/GDSL hydrolase family protein [Neomegalonema sp.]